MKIFKPYSSKLIDRFTYKEFFSKRNLFVYLIPGIVLLFTSFYMFTAFTHPDWSYKIYEVKEFLYTKKLNKERSHQSDSPVYDINLSISSYPVDCPDAIYEMSYVFKDMDCPGDIYIIKKYEETGKYYCRKFFWSGFDRDNVCLPIIIMFFIALNCLSVMITLDAVNDWYNIISYDDIKRNVQSYNQWVNRTNALILKTYILFYSFMGISKETIINTIYEEDGRAKSYYFLKDVTLNMLKRLECNK